MADIETFRNHIIEQGIQDAEGVHHEFVSGLHGQKLDFDKVAEDSPLYGEWIDVTAAYIDDEYPELPKIILGVANGTNRVALDTAREFEGQVIGLWSEKDPRNSKVLRLGKLATKVLASLQPELVVVLEDVGTTGSNSVQVAQHALAAGAQHVEVLNTWQRSSQLVRLEEVGISYRSIIKEVLTAYQPDECRALGYCADGWMLVARS